VNLQSLGLALHTHATAAAGRELAATSSACTTASAAAPSPRTAPTRTSSGRAGTSRCVRCPTSWPEWPTAACGSSPPGSWWPPAP